MEGPQNDLGFEEPEAPKSGRPYFAAALAIAGIAVVWGLGLGSFLINPKELEKPKAPRPDLFPVDIDDQRGAALEVWRRFLEAEDFEGRVAEVKDPKRVEPLMKDFYETREHPFPTMSKLLEGRVGDSGLRRVVVFAVEPFSGPNYGVSLEWDGERYRVDWESLVAYGTMDWHELTEGRPDESQRMRVFLSPLKDRWQRPGLPEGYRSFLMEGRAVSDGVPVVAGREVAAAIVTAVPGERSPVRVELKWSQALESLEIVRFIGPFWSE